MSMHKEKAALSAHEHEAKPEEASETKRHEEEQHPVAVGATAAGGGIAGAVIGAAGGAIAGPIGAAAGAAVGAILGGMAGKQLAESFTQEDIYFREHFPKQPYVKPEHKYEDFEPAYRYGWEAGERFEGTYFEEIEPELQRGWTTAKPSLPWEEARLAARDAWDRRRQRLLDATQRPSEVRQPPVEKDQAVIRDEE
ncbi:MAG TPA: hypothetical protein VGN42_09020 [Pirellulales bacterium]|nr:hypothetical protein [Pirellulales bacterium]